MDTAGIVFLVVFIAIVGSLYVWYLRLAAKWTLNAPVGRKLCWAFVAVAVAIVGVGMFIAETIGGRPVLMVLSPLAQLLFGAWFFGRFAKTREDAAPGFVGGLKMTGIAIAMLGVTLGLLMSLGELFPRD